MDYPGALIITARKLNSEETWAAQNRAVVAQSKLGGNLVRGSEATWFSGAAIWDLAKVLHLWKTCIFGVLGSLPSHNHNLF